MLVVFVECVVGGEGEGVCGDYGVVGEGGGCRVV